MKTRTEYPPRDIIVVYSQRMAGYLMQRGFYLVGVQPNLKRPGRNTCKSKKENRRNGMHW